MLEKLVIHQGLIQGWYTGTVVSLLWSGHFKISGTKISGLEINEIGKYGLSYRKT